VAPVPYASYEDLAERYGGQQLFDVTPKPADYDPEEPEDFDPQEFWDRMLLAGAVELDSSFGRGGYTTPFVESDGTTIIPEVEPILREYNVLMALDLAQVARIAESDPIALATERMKASLARYVSGEIRLPGVGIADAAIKGAVSSAVLAREVYGVDPFRDLSNVVRVVRSLPS
jgi:hypothetical protein